MKKLISLSVVASMFCISAVAQDTSLNRPAVPQTNLLDTVPDTKKWSQDSTKMDMNRDSTNKQWPDTSFDNRNNMQKDSLSTQKTLDTTSTYNTTDSMQNREQAKDDWKLRKDQDSMSTSTTTTTTTTTTDSSSATVSDRVMMKDDAMVVIKDGQTTPLDKEYTLPSGATISTTGEVKYPSGKTVQLKNGQFIALTDDADTKPEKVKKDKKKKKDKSES